MIKYIMSNIYGKSSIAFVNHYTVQILLPNQLLKW